MSSILLRITVGGTLLIAALIAPWWIPLVFGVILSFLYSVYGEFIAVAFLLDVGYGSYYAASLAFPWLTVSALGVVIIAVISRQILRFYDDPINSLTL